MIPLSYNFRNLRARKTTTVAAAGGLALVVFVFASVLMLSHGIERTLGRTGSDDVAIVLRKGSDAELSSPIAEPQVGLILATPGVARDKDGRSLGVGEVVIVMLLDKIGTTGVSNVQVRGVPDQAMAFRPGIKIIAGKAPQPGSDEVMVGKAVRGRFKGLEIGQSFEFRKNRPAKVVGVFEDGGSSYESEVWGDINTIRAAFAREGYVSSVRVKLEAASKFEAFEATIEQNRQLGLEVMRETDFYEKQSEGTSTFIRVMGLLIAVFFSMGAMIGAMITMHASVAHRQKEIGTLRALGFSKATILCSFLFESALLALIGGIVGAVASLGMMFVRFSMMNFASWSEIVFTFEPTPRILLSSVLAAVFMGLVGGFFPAVRAARMNPVVAMRA